MPGGRNQPNPHSALRTEKAPAVLAGAVNGQPLWRVCAWGRAGHLLYDCREAGVVTPVTLVLVTNSPPWATLFVQTATERQSRGNLVAQLGRPSLSNADPLAKARERLAGGLNSFA
jgi:hypothetical protein